MTYIALVITIFHADWQQSIYLGDHLVDDCLDMADLISQGLADNSDVVCEYVGRMD